MARRNSDDIFKKLNKEKPLVKRKSLSPLSSADFTPKKSKSVKISKVSVLSESDSRARRKAQSKQAAKLASSYHSAKKNRSVREVPKSIDAEPPVAKRRKTAASAKKVQPRRQPKPSEDLMMDGHPTKQPAASKAQPGRQPKPSEDLVMGTHQAKQPATSKAQPRRHPKPSEDLVMDRHQAEQPEVSKAQPGRQPNSSEDLMFSTPKAQQPSSISSLTRTRSQSVPEVENKGMRFRHEIKYYINHRDYVILSNALRAVMSLDAYARDDNMYHIRSLYFDDIYESALFQKVSGTDDRYKYRIRIYNHSDAIIKFEKKIKKGQFVTKRSITITRDEYEAIISGDIDFLLDREEPLAREIYLEMKNKRLRPRVLVDYLREAYVSPLEDVRITFDKQLKGGLCVTDIFNQDSPSMPMFEKGMMVLEIKFNRFLPEYIKGVLQNINAANKSAISKYVICRRFD